MRAYSFSKKLTKITIAAAVFAISITAGSLFYAQIHYSADTNTACQIPNPPSVAIKPLSQEKNTAGNVDLGVNNTADPISYVVTKTINGQTTQVGQGDIFPASQTFGTTDTVPFSFTEEGDNQATISVTLTDKNSCTKTTSKTFTVSIPRTPFCQTVAPATIVISTKTIKPGEGVPIKVTNPTDNGNEYTADVYISDGKGSYSSPVIDGQAIPKKTTQALTAMTPSDIILGQHHLRVDVYYLGCLAGTKEIQFCVSKKAPTCTNAADEQITATSGSTAAGGSGGGTGGSGAVANPDIHPSSITNLKDLINKKLVPLLSVFLAVLLFAGCIVGGYMTITAGGNEAQAAKGKKAILYSILGIVIGSLAYWITKAVEGTLANMK